MKSPNRIEWNIVDGRIPLLVGVIDTETERVIENIKAVEEIEMFKAAIAGIMNPNSG